MAFNAKEQEIIRFGSQNGKTREQVEQAIANLRSGVIPTPKVQAEPSFTESIGTDLNMRADKVGAIQDRYARGESGLGEAFTQTFGQGAGAAANVIEKTAEQIPGVKQAVGAIGAGIKWLTETAPIKAVGDKIGDNKWLQDATALYDTDPNFKDTVDGVANIARLTGDVQMTADAVNLVKNATAKLTSTVKTTVGDILPPDGGAGSLSFASDNVLKAGAELKNNIQLSIARKNVSPQLESSANRLFLEGTKNLETPVATYDKYLAQSKKAIGDIKADPAISQVGEKMGDAFETVIKQRQSVGKVLGDELKANGKIKINILEPKNNLLAELKGSGLSYNPKTKNLTSLQGSKFAPEEVSMLDDFVNSVIRLGDNPSVSQIDNFISKTRATLQFTKGKSGVMGTTNAERIINGGISKLRATLDPAVNGNTALSKYWSANKTYSELSDFVDEGSTFLGKKTLSGDFAKDASVAKSSVQSILNQGKKDFMIKLEALTGYKAIDDAVLALQAMKDAGDFRGLSLLQAMSETGIPTSKGGVTQKILDYALSKGGEFIAGTPEEQTRALLQSLENSLTKPTAVKPTSKIKPTTGAKTNSSNQTKSSKTVIQPKTTTPTKKVKGITPEQVNTEKIRQQFGDKVADAGTTKDPLAVEAKKYKSAEEFVKAQGTPVFHGTDISGADSISKGGFKIMGSGNAESGISLSPNKKISGIFSGKDGKIIDAVISPDANLMQGDKFDAILGKLVREKKMPYKTKQEQAIVDSLAAKEAKKLGYDGVDWRGQSEGIESLSDEIRVWNTDKIKTKSQLTDIWNKANKKK